MLGQFVGKKCEKVFQTCDKILRNNVNVSTFAR